MRTRIVAIGCGSFLCVSSSVAAAQASKTCPPNVLAPLSAGITDPKTGNPFEGNWCGFWGGAGSGLRIHVTGANTADVVTTYDQLGTIYTSRSEATIDGNKLSYSITKRGTFVYTLKGTVMSATLQNNYGTFIGSFEKIR